MSRLNKKNIAITMGDPQGIGPEIIRKALKDKELLLQGSFIVIGDRKGLGRLPSGVSVIDLPYKTPGEASLKFLDKAVLMIKGGIADALVTAPLSKESVSRYHKNFVGHTEYLAQAFEVKNFDMMFIAHDVRLTIVTRHVPLKNVPALITSAAVYNSINLMADTLKSKFRIKKPKIAVLGLNPHAGEGGLLGTEDIKSILPAIRKAKDQGINAIGPLPADTFFAFYQKCQKAQLFRHREVFCHCEERSDEAISFDGIIAMYHDQGLAPIKGMYMKELVNYTAGLPFIRTSPAHGTAYDIAGKNMADPSSMIAAIKLAINLSSFA